MKSFWIALNSDGIWHQLLSKIYEEDALARMAQREIFFTHNASIIWKGFLKNLHWIGKGILWQVGNGSDIRLGVDPVIGMSNSFLLPDDLRAYLEDYGINTLAQARNKTPFAAGYWFTAEELDFGGEWKYLLE